MSQNSRILDISVPVFPGMLHPGRQPEPRYMEKISDGDPGNVTRWHMGAHTGTHIEAPLHTRRGGPAVHEIGLDVLVGPARVLDLTGVASEITAADLLDAGLADEVRVLLKTTNSDGPLQGTSAPASWVGLAPDGARLLVDRGVRLVGIDFYTVEAPGRDKTFDAHYILSAADIVTIEQVDLSAAQAGVYELVCLPIPIRGAEAAPARAVLLPVGAAGRELSDISVPVHEGMLHWGRRPVREVVESMDDGDACNVTRWDIGSHTGLHIDAGLHFDDTGAPIDEMSLDILIGPARVLDLTGVTVEITAADLEAAGLADEPRVLLKTANSQAALQETDKPPFWVGLAPDGAQLLVDRGVRLVGIDFLTIDSPTRDETWDTHLILCPAAVAIVECTDLRDVPAGVHELVCLPVKLRGSEAAPGAPSCARSRRDGRRDRRPARARRGRGS